MELPQSISEKLLFSTIRLEVGDSKATGFIYDDNGDNTNQIIVTNRHVIEAGNGSPVVFHLHYLDNGKISKSILKIKLDAKWQAHSNHDLVFCPLWPIINEATKQGIFVYYQSVSSSLIPSKEDFSSLNAIEEVVMIGYPNGLWDESNNLPIIRKGFTASHPAYSFKNKSQDIDLEDVCMIDIAAFPGSSGSPVFLLNEFGYYDKLSNSYINKQRILLLGILYKGPVYVQKTIKEDYTPLMMNLGYIIKSNVIQELIQKK
ncbi:MAG: S1 family peptidase [Patescibacteria group bacterium]